MQEQNTEVQRIEQADYRSSLRSSHGLDKSSQDEAKIHQIKGDQETDMYKQYFASQQFLQQKKDSKAAEERAKQHTDSPVVSDKQQLRGRPRYIDIKRAENRLRQRRRRAMMSADEKRAIQEKDKLRKSEKRKEMTEEEKQKVQEEDRIQHSERRENMTKE